MTLPFNETCFGKHVFGNNGNPEGFRPLMGSCNHGFHACFVVPRKKAGEIEFVMTLSEEEMESLIDGRSCSCSRLDDEPRPCKARILIL